MNRGLQFPGFTKKKNQYYLLLPTIRTFIFLKEIQRLKHNLRNLPWSSAMMLVVTKGGTAPRVDVWKSPPRFTLSSSITWICDIQKHTMPREKPNRHWRDKRMKTHPLILSVIRKCAADLFTNSAPAMQGKAMDSKMLVFWVLDWEQEYRQVYRQSWPLPISKVRIVAKLLHSLCSCLSSIC